MSSILHRLLLRVDPERAHAAALSLARIAGAVAPLRALVRRRYAFDGDRPAQLFGVRFANRVGLAAGYDKDAVAWRGLACLGFGHVEIGTVTPLPQPGNERPRVFRLRAQLSVINRLGFPSGGADAVAKRLGGTRPPGLVVGVNIGKQRDTPIERAAQDYEALIDRFSDLADYVAVNISSPNTPGLRRLGTAAAVEPLLERIAARRDERQRVAGRRVPVLVKLSPDMPDADLAAALASIERTDLDGVIATNTTVARDGLTGAAAEQQGGLSGRALTARSTAVVRRVRELAGRRLPVIACGGVMCADDAAAKLAAGADLVQLYTGLVYAGPRLVLHVRRGLSAADAMVD